MIDPILETTETYDAIADQYIQNYTDRTQWQGLYDLFLTRLTGKKILDIGSGPGHDAKIFTEAGLDVTGIDMSEKLLKHAKVKAPLATFEKMDMRHLTFPSKTFDGIWALASIQHLPKADILATLKGIRRVIRPDGIFYLSVTRGEGEGYLEKDRYAGRRKYFANYTEGEISHHLTEAGFRVEEFVHEDRQDKFWNIFARPVA